MKRKILIASLLLLLASGGTWLYFHFRPRPSSGLQLTEMIPPGDVFTLQTGKARKAWEKIHKHIIFQDLARTARFRFLQSLDTVLTRYILQNKTTSRFFRNRPFAMSAHLVAGNDYDFLYVLDLKQNLPARQIIQAVRPFLPRKVRIRSISGTGRPAWKITGLTDDPLYATVRDNLVAFSFSYQIIRQSLLTSHTEPLPPEAEETDGLILFRFRYEKLTPFLRTLGWQPGTMARSLSENLRTAYLAVDEDHNLTEAAGPTLADSSSVITNLLSRVEPARTRAQEILPASTMIYTALLTGDFETFYRQALDSTFRRNPRSRTRYKHDTEQLRQYLNIDLHRDFISWIGDEIGIAKWSSGTSKRSAALLIRADDIDYARERLLHINKMLQRRSPIRFKAYRHEGHTIYYLTQRKLFTLLFGRWLSGSETPYYTFIDDFVVFANDANELEQLITAYQNGNTLSRSRSFRPITREIDGKTHLRIWFSPPALYNWTYRSSPAATRRLLRDYYDLFHHMTHMSLEWTVRRPDLIRTRFLIRTSGE